MLAKCPECNLQVSDKALSCPHCGFPLQPEATLPKPSTTRKKRRRLPNGFGQISRIKNQNLRNPFRAMVTVGKTSSGRPICKPLKPESYFPTYNDAYAALVAYHKNPYDLDSDITLKELFERWIVEHEKTVKTTVPYKTAWAYCSELYNVQVRELRARHIKHCLTESVATIRGKEQKPSAAMQNIIKTLFNLMLDYAVEYEIVDRNYSRTFHLSEDTLDELSKIKSEHIPFTDKEIEILWQNVDQVPIIDVILIQCYSGWRPQELCLIKLKNVDLENWTFMGGMKTKDGFNRIVPIHSRIRPLVERKYKEAQSRGNEYLLINPYEKPNKEGAALTYKQYAYRFQLLIDKLNLDPKHRPHDGRKHFVTMAKKSNVDEYAIKYIVGHHISDITEKVYTQRSRDWLKNEIEKIK